MESMSAYLPTKRPFAVTLVLWGVIVFGIWNVSKAVALALNSELLMTHNMQPDPRFHAIVALVWAVLFLVAAWSLRQARPYTQLGIPLLLLLFGLYTIGIRLFFSPLPYWSGSGGITTLFFGSVVVLSFLALKRAGQKRYFVDRRTTQ